MVKIAFTSVIRASIYRDNSSTVSLAFLMMNKHDLGWDVEKGEWFCVRCLRGSDHSCKEDAQRELEQFDCSPPTAPWLAAKRH